MICEGNTTLEELIEVCRINIIVGIKVVTVCEDAEQIEDSAMPGL